MVAAEKAADALIAWKVVYATPLEHLLQCLDFLVGVIGLSINSALIVYVCSRQKRLRSSRTSHNLAVVSVALADVVLTAVVSPVTWAVDRPRIIEESSANYLCKLNRYIYNWMSTAMIYSIVAMFLTKYVKFKATHKYTFVTTPSIFTLSIVWFFGAGFNIWQLMLYSTRYTIVSGYGHAFNTTAVRRCLPVVSDDLFIGIVGQRTLTSIDLIMLYMLPVFLIGFLFSGIVNSPMWSRKRIKDKKQLVMSVAFFTVYFVCKLPLDIFDHTIEWAPVSTPATTRTSDGQLGLRAAVEDTTWSSRDVGVGAGSVLLRHALCTLSSASALLNPWTYAALSPELRNSWSSWKRKRRAKRTRTGDIDVVAAVANGVGHERSNLVSRGQNGEAITIIVEFHD